MGKKYKYLAIIWISISLITLGMPNLLNLCLPSIFFRYAIATLLITGWLLGVSALVYSSYLFVALILIPKELGNKKYRPSMTILFRDDQLNPKGRIYRKKFLNAFRIYLIIFILLWAFAYLNSRLNFCNP